VFDCIIIGCGLTGASIARHLAEQHVMRVQIVDRRNHIGGNMYDYHNEDGILLQKYGPHTFHTNDEWLYRYLGRFAQWKPYKLKCMAEIDGIITPMPFNYQTIDDFFDKHKAKEIKRHIQVCYGNALKATIVDMLQSSDVVISEYARFLFEKDYRPYTAKQWGISPSEIDVSVLQRVPVVFSYDTDYFDDKFQVIPQISYTNFFENLLAHPLIAVELGVDAKAKLTIQDNMTYWNGRPFFGPIIYTGALDELFDCRYGALPYRSLRFEIEQRCEKSFQPTAIVAYPQVEGYTRITEYTKLPVQETRERGTVLVAEYPFQYESNRGHEPYYPILTNQSKELYQRYATALEKVNNLYFCGRLADFRYYNMDQALQRALEVCKELDAALPK
jgi:UDP-galactopyranose mutase